MGTCGIYWSQAMRIGARDYPTLVVISAVAIVMSLAARAETESERRSRILTETKVNVVAGLKGPAAEFKDDGDPMTIEIFQ